MRKLLRFVLWTAILLGTLVGIARVTAIRWWRVPDNDPYLEASIAPTLRGGDLVILWRLTKPVYGDLVVCPEPDAPERVVIGRYLGEAGDKIRIVTDNVWINDRKLETETACTERRFTVEDPEVGTEVEQHCHREVAGNRTYMRGSAAGQRVRPQDVDQDVPEGRVFLVSDNRLFPYDSRDFGTVDPDTCTETVVFRLVSREGFFDVKNRLSIVH